MAHKRHHAQKPAAPQRVSGTLAEQAVRADPVAGVTRSGAGDRLRPIIVAMIAAACLLVAVGLTPLRLVPWRPAALALADRQVTCILVGTGLLAITVFAMLVTSGR